MGSHMFGLIDLKSREFCNPTLKYSENALHIVSRYDLFGNL